MNRFIFKKNKREKSVDYFLLQHIFYPIKDRGVTLNRLINAGIAMLVVCVLGTWGYWLIGQGEWRWLQCLYMVLITITTVGYGEALPVSDGHGSLVFTVFLLISGLGVSFYFLSALTAFIIEGDLKEAIWRRRMGKIIQDFTGHFIVCGAGEVGKHVIVELIKARQKVIVLDSNESHLEWIDRQLETDTLEGENLEFRLMKMIGDATEDEILSLCGVERAEGLISALPTDRDNLFVVVTAHQMNPQLRIISRATNERAATKIRRAGADAVVCPNTIGGLRMASELLRPTVVGFVDLIVRDSIDNQLTVEELLIPAHSPLCGKQLLNSGIRKIGNVLVLSVFFKKKQYFNPPPELVLEEGMTLVALGEIDDLDHLKNYVIGAVIPPSLQAQFDHLKTRSIFNTPYPRLNKKKGIE